MTSKKLHHAYYELIINDFIWTLLAVLSRHPYKVTLLMQQIIQLALLLLLHWLLRQVLAQLCRPLESVRILYQR